jgi:hypothetical protein
MPGHAGTKVLHHVQVLEHSHQRLVAGDGIPGKEVLPFFPRVNITRGGHFQTVGEYFEFGDQFGDVIVMDNSIDDCLAQGDPVPEVAVYPFSRRLCD